MHRLDDRMKMIKQDGLTGGSTVRHTSRGGWSPARREGTLGRELDLPVDADFHLRHESTDLRPSRVERVESIRAPRPSL